MRFFIAIDFQHLVLALFLGLAATLVIYLAFRYGTNREASKEEGLDTEYIDEVHTSGNPVPPVLLFVYVGFVLWLIFYVVFTLLKGRPL